MVLNDMAGVWKTRAEKYDTIRYKIANDVCVEFMLKITLLACSLQ